MVDSVTWELTITEEPARTLLKWADGAYRQSQLGNDKDIAVLRAICHQHPKLIKEFPHLPWPFSLREFGDAFNP